MTAVRTPENRHPVLSPEQISQLSQRRSRRFSSIVAILIIGAGLASRMALLNVFSVDSDESMHFQVSKEPSLLDAYRHSLMHTHPPLIFLFYHYWIRLGDSEVMLRIPSLVFGVSGLWLAYLWLRELTDEWAALGGVCLLTFSMPMMFVSVQMRGYTLFLLFALGSLYLRERFFATTAPKALVGSTLLLTLAMLTHYSAAWIILTLGILTLLRVAAGELRSQSVMCWILSQLWLLTVCGMLFLGHAARFSGSNIETEMWRYGEDPRFRTSLWTNVKLSVAKLVEFHMAHAAIAWPILACLVVAGAAFLFLTTRKKADSSLLGLERGGLVLAPITIALLLLFLRIYPLGATRHSLWLLPFLSAGVAASLQACLHRSRRFWGLAFTAAFAIWAWNNGFNAVRSVRAQITPHQFETYVAVLRQTIPSNEIIVTDESTRNVLDYYLERETLNHGQLPGNERTKYHDRKLGEGFYEYQLGGYRVIAIPEMRFEASNMRTNWAEIEKFLGDRAREPVWIAYLGWGLPERRLEQLASRLPPGRLLQRVSSHDDELLRVLITPTQQLKN